MAITDIESGDHQYYVKVGLHNVGINVVDGSSGKYLRTDPDKTNTNNLDDLPDCWSRIWSTVFFHAFKIIHQFTMRYYHLNNLDLDTVIESITFY